MTFKCHMCCLVLFLFLMCFCLCYDQTPLSCPVLLGVCLSNVCTCSVLICNSLFNVVVSIPVCKIALHIPERSFSDSCLCLNYSY